MHSQIALLYANQACGEELSCDFIDLLTAREAKLILNFSSKLKYFFLSLAVVVFDQVTKVIASSSLGFGDVVTIFPFFDLQLSYNSGAAFGFLGSAGGWQQVFFSIVAVFAIILLVGWMARQPRHKIKYTIGLALILGGAAGNLIDRVLYGHVTDFILLHWQSHNFPNFNIADSGITIGVLLLMLDSLKSKGDEASKI